MSIGVIHTEILEYRHLKRSDGIIASQRELFKKKTVVLHVGTINLHSDVIGGKQVTEQEDSLSGR